MPTNRNGPGRGQIPALRNRKALRGAKVGRTDTLRTVKPRKTWRFAADAIGMMEGPRDLSARKGLGV